MVDRAEGYEGWTHLVWRNLAGFLLGVIVFAGIWLSPGEDWPWRTLVGAILGGLSWVGVMFVSAKGH